MGTRRTHEVGMGKGEGLGMLPGNAAYYPPCTIPLTPWVVPCRTLHIVHLYRRSTAGTPCARAT